ncbi:MAG: hypothetical protein HY257_05975 [Chloroflexi bacterium]|nr:hypothetical protein [Chloroflexota bacterium]
MATTANELKRLQREVAALKEKVARLERGREDYSTRRADKLETRASSENERADEILRRAGLLAEPSPEEISRAERWMALPQAQREKLRGEFYNAKLDKPLSEIVIENRR